MKRTIASSSDELQNQYNYLSSGHFFDTNAMRFFKSRVTSNYRRIDDDTALFITTEKFDDNSPRLATVRIARLIHYIRESDGRACEKISISTYGVFNKLSLYEAKKSMNEAKPREIETTLDARAS